MLSAKGLRTAYLGAKHIFITKKSAFSYLLKNNYFICTRLAINNRLLRYQKISYLIEYHNEETYTRV